MSNPITNIYSTLHSDSAVKAVVDDRIYTPIAKQNAETPFVVWQMISNSPYSSVSGGACADHQTMQIDVYANSDGDSRELIFKCRDALAPDGFVVRGPEQMSITLDTEIYRWSMDVDYVHQRGA